MMEVLPEWMLQHHGELVVGIIVILSLAPSGILEAILVGAVQNLYADSFFPFPFSGPLCTF